MAILKSARISKTAACRGNISSISTLCGRKAVYVQLLDLLSVTKFHAQMWQFWKSSYISETAACKTKISSFATPWGRKSVYLQLPEVWPKAKLVLKQFIKAHGPLIAVFNVVFSCFMHFYAIHDTVLSVVIVMKQIINEGMGLLFILCNLFNVGPYQSELKSYSYILLLLRLCNQIILDSW